LLQRKKPPEGGCDERLLKPRSLRSTAKIAFLDPLWLNSANLPSTEFRMRDTVTSFYFGVVERLISANIISRTDSVLVVCGGPLDEKVWREAGFADVTITNIDAGATNHWQDAENLTYEESSFDVVAVHAGLHHCYSPNRALLEMYRVSRKCAVAFEARESLLMRVAVRFGLTEEYEQSAISADGKRGGVADTEIPNFVCRWTERDVYKTIASYDPTRSPNITFFYEWRIPLQRFTRGGSKVLRVLGLIAEQLSPILAKLAPKKGNEFAFAVLKNGDTHPWITGCE
jgi:SAM-dependent methyltransferase